MDDGKISMDIADSQQVLQTKSILFLQVTSREQLGWLQKQ